MYFWIGHFILLLVIGLISLIFHEIGHIIAARLRHARHIQLTIGTGEKFFSFSIGRLKIIVHRWFFSHFVTFSSRNKGYTANEMMIISIMGPIFSVLLAVIFYVLFSTVFSMYLLYIGSLFNLWLGLFNMLPLKIGQKATDGYMIYKILIGSK